MDHHRFISPCELAEKLDNDDVLLVDVRSPEEHAICTIENSISIPLQELTSRIGEMDKQRDIVIYCKSGIRGAKAVEFLNAEGFARVRNLDGGIMAWTKEVDREMPSY